MKLPFIIALLVYLLSPLSFANEVVEGFDWKVKATYDRGSLGEYVAVGTGNTKPEALFDSQQDCKIHTVNSHDHFCTNNPNHTKYEKINCKDIKISESDDSHHSPVTTWLVCTGYAFSFEKNGNLVHRNKNNQIIWESGTSGSGANKLSIQKDGNLVLYVKAHGGKPQKAVWSTKTKSEPKVHLYVQRDGNVVLSREPRNSENVLWDTKTTGK